MGLKLYLVVIVVITIFNLQIKFVMFSNWPLGILCLTLQMKDSYELHDPTHICQNFDLVQWEVS